MSLMMGGLGRLLAGTCSCQFLYTKTRLRAAASKYSPKPVPT